MPPGLATSEHCPKISVADLQGMEKKAKHLEGCEVENLSPEEIPVEQEKRRL